MTNRATLDGHLGADPEIRATSTGGQVATLRLATSENWTDKATGERKERSHWHTIVVFNDWLISHVVPLLKKGSRCLVEGQIETRKYQDRAGNDKYTTEIIVRGGATRLLPINWPRSERGAPPPSDDPRTAMGGSASTSQTGGRPSDFDDDIPF